MAMCEKCKNPTNYTPNEMFVSLEGQMFVGPCCAPTTHCVPVRRRDFQPAQVLPFKPQEQQLDYGIELSNKVGVRAWVNYEGLQLSFERDPKQLKDWAERQGLVSSVG